MIRLLREMIECSHKIKEEVKTIQNEIQKDTQGTNNEGKAARIQINDLEQKEEINIQLEQNEETRFQKSEKRLRNFWDNFKCTNIQIIGVPGGEEEEQVIENYLE